MATNPTASPSTRASQPSDTPDSIIFDSELNSRTYTLNRPRQRNALDIGMIQLLRSKIEEWEISPRCEIIIGAGNGGTFCAGGDVKTIVEALAKGDSAVGLKFFKEEFELDFALASLRTPYVAILDGITMGGGVGLSINALFRVATERTIFAMPETKIGYSPDVGASFFLPRMDGALGRYLGLTGETLTGREVFEAGIATHFVASHRLPQLLDRLKSLSKPTPDIINNTLEEFYSERLSDESASKTVTGSGRAAVDAAFSNDTMEGIWQHLEKMATKPDNPAHAEWAATTLEALKQRSPTSLRVALELMKRGESKTLAEALGVELGIATAFCTGASQDFVTGVTALLIDKQLERPDWDPKELNDIEEKDVLDKFFSPDSPYLKEKPTATFTQDSGPQTDPMQYSLPSEEDIRKIVEGRHPTSSDVALNLPELVQRAAEIYRKAGVEDKVRDVVSRKCEVVPGTETQESFVRWIH